MARTALVGAGAPATDVWAYNATVPGPSIRLRQGERLRVQAVNRLAENTTVHWHGIRLPNSMDGVPDLTQRPIIPGGSFLYEFDAPDAGTFWYHPHSRSYEQVDRGLAGALIVEEHDPPDVDRDLVWVLDDWRLAADASITSDFANAMDMSHAGRLGNTVTINGQVQEELAVRAGERLRLRLLNVANARIFGLAFSGHAPQIIAIDGQPTEPHAPENGRIVLGPGMRIDIILDLALEPGSRVAVTDDFYRNRSYKLVDLVYRPERALRSRSSAEVRLPPNPLARPDLEQAERHAIEFGGGMMDPKMRRRMMSPEGMTPEAREMMARSMMERMRAGHIWTINGKAAEGHLHEPDLLLRHGKSYVLDMLNDTAWHHTMHLHGMTFQVVSRNGRTLTRPVWQDTVLMDPGERVAIAFAADNPGDWMFHCHVLEHQASGMMSVVRVS